MLNGIVRPAALGLVLSLSTVTCTSGVGPGTSERWAADLTGQRVLFMTLERRDATITGTGTLTSLTNPGGDPLTLVGTRTADTLRITYQRQLADPFRLTGRYVGSRIDGVLDGAEFVQVAVSFRLR